MDWSPIVLNPINILDHLGTEINRMGTPELGGRDQASLLWVW